MITPRGVVDDTVGWLGDGSHWSGADGVPNRLLEHLGYSLLTVGVNTTVFIIPGTVSSFTRKFGSVKL